MTPEPSWWLPYIQPFATVGLGLAASVLAYRQWRTASEKLRLDLYERRYEVLDSVLADLNEVIQHADNHRARLGSTLYNLGRMKTLFTGNTERIIDELQSSVEMLFMRGNGISKLDRASCEFKTRRSGIGQVL